MDRDPSVADRPANSPPRIEKARRVSGRHLVFRDADVSDAAFILALRTSAGASRFLSATAPDVQAQEAWLRRYATGTGQAYFVIQSRAGDPLGCVRLYDARGDSFCWGSWILKAGAPQSAAVESALIVYAFAIDHLGFRQAHFDVRKDNERVWQFHERFGAERIGETEADHLYRIGAPAIARSRARYGRFLPDPIAIERMP